MTERNANNPADYEFTRSLNAAQWAWEFLRRNPGYAAEWQSFHATWKALEMAYGRPPDRDFCAWKQDPRAWVPASECADGECRIDQDKVLIECALGARWGFYKFPPDPHDDDPVGSGRMSWRPLDEVQPIVQADDRAWLGGEPARIALGFDLALPLREQLERAKRTLQVIQRQRLAAGHVRAATVASWRDELALMLRLLDAEPGGSDDGDLAAVAADWPQLLAAARTLRDGDYRSLTRLRDD